MDVVNSNICRTCLTKQQTQMQSIFKVISMLQKGAAVNISIHDNLPKNICDMCYQKATNAYAFYCQCERSEEILKRTFSDISEIRSEFNVVITSNEHDIVNRAINYSNNGYNCLYPNECDNDFVDVESIRTIHVSSEENSNITIVTSNHHTDYNVVSNRVDQETDFNNSCLMPCKWNQFDHYGEIQEELRHDPLPTNYATDAATDEFYEQSTQLIIDEDINVQSEESRQSLVDLLTVDNNCQQVKDQLKCNQCEIKFTSKVRLKTHIREVHKKRYVCDSCSRIFHDHSNFVRHVRIHNGDLPFVCHQCPDKRFAQSNQLKSHLLTHSKIKEHLCNICGESHARVNSLRTHMRRKHSQSANKRLYSCNICSKTFKVSADLSQHMLIHREGNKYNCDVCGKAFNRKNNLKVHQLIHSNKKPFQCVLCPKAFRQKSALEGHMVTHKS